MATAATKLNAHLRETSGSRATRRLRRAGRVPGVVYGGGEEPMSVEVDARELRQALAQGGAVMELAIDGGKSTPVVLKDEQRHPVLDATVHIDLLRVRLDVEIEATVILELTGVEEAPGVKEGGVLEQVTRELNVEALPTAIPDVIEHDVGAMEINDTITLAAVAAPEGVKLLDDPDETVIATLLPPRLPEEEEEIEQETELVGEGVEGEAAEEQAEGATAEEAAGDGDSGGE